MPNRQPFVGGNWKMNTDSRTSVQLARAIAQSPTPTNPVDIAVFPPFVYLSPVRDALADAHISLGAQNLSDKPNGALTGEISADMLKDLTVTHVLTGHSERRHLIGEPDSLIASKTNAALDAGLTCVLCIGETLEQRETNQTDQVNETQLRAALTNISPDHAQSLVIAYEPVWAIGTGKTATPEDAQNAHATIRSLLSDIFSPTIADALRIIYGGSAKPSNAEQLFSQPDIDGGLIGGASLIPNDFIQICAHAAASPQPQETS